MAGPSIVSRWGGRAAESLFAVLFPSDCRICGAPLVTISRLPEPSPAGLTSHRRRENMLGAFTVGRPEEVKERPLVGVDDVYTSGTNVSGCARVLDRAQHLKCGSPPGSGRLKVSVRELESCEVRKAMKRLSRWRKPPEASSEVLGGHSSRGGMLSDCRKLSVDALGRARRRAGA